MSLPRASIGLGLMAVSAALVLRPAEAQMVPTDAEPTCVIAPAAFASMFESGTVTLNGVVRPADSTRSLDPPPLNCPFFMWSEQMFLWLTSPVPMPDGGSRPLMFSSSFFTVSPLIGTGPISERRRSFMRNPASGPIPMRLRATELGPHMLPALMSRTGQVVEAAPADPAAPVPPLVRLSTGATVRLGDVRRAPAGELQFFDTRGREVQVRRAAPPSAPRATARTADGRRLAVVPVAAMREVIQAREFDLNGIPIFVDADNNVIDVEPFQARTNGVLLVQNGAPIYYITTVNDVFAFHRTMQGAALIPEDNNIRFPLTMADVNAVVDFAASHGQRIAHPEALAIETKSSWVEASAVPNPDDYIQIEATIPVWDTTSNPNVWREVPNQERRVRLVMVGLHVVGSTAGHGEMVWATFEHNRNAPNAAYSYDSTSGPRTVPQDTTGSWLFTPTGSAGPFNVLRAQWDMRAGTVNGESAATPPAPSPVLRMLPWGTAANSPSANALNTQVIAVNASVIGQLLAGDVRRNYFQMGTTWTAFGATPTPSNQVGTNKLANATMETYLQESPTRPNSNCFTCHGSNPDNPPTVAVSHIYRQMNPLF